MGLGAFRNLCTLFIMTAFVPDSSYWISHLSLQPHPEGGFYRETYRAAESIHQGCLPERFTGARSFCTAIFYLLQAGDFSGFHRIRSDEVWHFYCGDPLELHVVQGAEYRLVTLGLRVDLGQSPQYVVPQGAWFASRPVAGGAYSLLGCTVSPGFDFADFEMGRAEDVFRECPQHLSSLAELCRIPSS